MAMAMAMAMAMKWAFHWGVSLSAELALALRERDLLLAGKTLSCRGFGRGQGRSAKAPTAGTIRKTRPAADPHACQEGWDRGNTSN